MRTYYCECGGKVEIAKDIIPECDCGKLFGYNFKTSNQINMRTTLSGTTKMEFSTTTIDESANSMNKGK